MKIGRFSWIGALIIIAIQGGYYLLVVGRRELEDRELSSFEVTTMLLGLALVISGLICAGILAKIDKQNASQDTEPEDTAGGNEL